MSPLILLSLMGLSLMMGLSLWARAVSPANVL